MTDEITVLAVDDDKMNLKMLGVMLTALDCRLLSACNRPDSLFNER